MLRKFMFIGLGGSGGKTLRYLRNDLSAWLRSIGWDGGFPVGWQLLHIDTPTVQDGSEITDVPMLPTENYLGLVMDGVDFDVVANRVDQSGGPNAWEDLASWRVDPTFLEVPITMGAGQFRAVGRTIGLAYADKILSALKASYSRVSTADAGAQLSEIHQLAYRSQANPPGDPVVVVVSSLAGGTGAGLFMDTCDLLRQLPGEAGDKSFAILYASDVFRELGSVATTGIQPNSLAALSELMNGYWMNANHQRLSPILAAAGAPNPLSRSGPAFPLLVGSANTKGVSFGSQREVYAMMGRALSAWASDPTVQDRLVAYTQANWQNSADGNTVKAPVLMANHTPIFEAFGYAEVSLGTDRLGRYSGQRLAREAARWLIDGHHRRAVANDRDENREPDQIAKDLARDRLVGFLDRLHLLERGKQDQVIDALRPPEHETVLHSYRAEIERELARETKALPSAAWVERIDRQVAAYAEQYRSDLIPALRQRGAKWAAQVPDSLIGETLAVVSQDGLDTATELLELVAEEFDAVGRELDDEATERRRWAQDPRSAIASKLGSPGNLPANNRQVSEAVWEGLWVAGYFVLEAEVRATAQSLLTQLAKGVVRPLRHALRNARHELYQIGFVGDGSTEPVVEAWPDRAVPASLQPPKNEFLVVPIEEFPSRYEQLISRSTGAEHALTAHEVARTDVITGAFLAEDPKRLRPVEVIQPWTPDTPGTGSPGAAQMAQFRIRLAPDDLLARSEEWIDRPGTAFQRFLSYDLRSYLDDDSGLDPGELAARRSALRSALTAAFAAAEPLVRLDLALYGMLHGQAEAPRRAVPSSIPFKDHPLEGDVREILASALGPNQQQQWEGAFTTSRNVSRISISSTLGAAHDPLVFESVMEPILAGWTAAKMNPAKRTSFWDNRRARSIREFVPASYEVMLAMTRGWFTALMLGRLDREERRIAAREGVVAFPDVLLREPANERDLLPVVLESLGLAYAEVVRMHDLAPLGAYIALRDLGCQPGLNDYKVAGLYENLNEELAEWIRSGKLTDAIADSQVERFADRDLSEASAPERQKAAIDLLAATEEDYRGKLDDYKGRARTDRSLLGPNRQLWPGMWSVIQRALVDLRGAVAEHDLEGTGRLM